MRTSFEAIVRASIVSTLLAACGDDTNGGSSGTDDGTGTPGETEPGTTDGSVTDGSSESAGADTGDPATDGSGDSDGTGTTDGTGGSDGGGSCEDGFCDEMIEIPAGAFDMGCDEVGPRCGRYETPRHEVYLDAFSIDKHEVTQAQYWACVDTGTCPVNPGVGCTQDLFDAAEPNHPMFCVSWDVAKLFCEAQGKRLPTEAEWEKAASSGDGRVFPWGDEEPDCDRANYTQESGQEGCGTGAVDAVGSRPDGASPYGVMDMSGNVSEFVSDWYSEDYYGQSPEMNPTGPDSGTRRVLRGASYHGDADDLRVFARWASNGGSHVGFRCAKSP